MRKVYRGARLELSRQHADGDTQRPASADELDLIVPALSCDDPDSQPLRIYATVPAYDPARTLPPREIHVRLFRADQADQIPADNDAFLALGQEFFPEAIPIPLHHPDSYAIDIPGVPAGDFIVESVVVAYN